MCAHMYAHTCKRLCPYKHTIPTKSLFPDNWKHHSEEQIGTDSVFLLGSVSTVETVKAGAVTALRARKSPKVIRSVGI